jgi:hypothetical protein
VGAPHTLEKLETAASFHWPVAEFKQADRPSWSLRESTLKMLNPPLFKAVCIPAKVVWPAIIVFGFAANAHIWVK